MSNELDLHGCLVIEAIDTFVTCYNSRVGSGNFTSLIVIHGYGSSGQGGVIRARLRSFLSRHSERLTFECGEQCALRNPGTTMVYPRKPLPTATDALGAEILAYCRESPKTKSKIAGKFRNHGEAKIQASLKRLEQQKILCVVRKGSHTLYQTAT